MRQAFVLASLLTFTAITAAAEPAADFLAYEPPQAAYRAYAERCKDYLDKAARYGAAGVSGDLAAAKRARIDPRAAERKTVRFGDPLLFATREEKEARIAELQEKIDANRRVQAMKREKRQWLPAPLPIPAEQDDLGALYSQVEVLHVGGDRAELRCGDCFLIYLGDVRGMTVGEPYRFAASNILLAVGEDSILVDGRRQPAAVLRSDNLIALVVEMRDVFGIK